MKTAAREPHPAVDRNAMTILRYSRNDAAAVISILNELLKSLY
jgi:hypothetical protein